MTTDLGLKRLYTGLRTTPSQAHTGLYLTWPFTTRIRHGFHMTVTRQCWCCYWHPVSRDFQVMPSVTAWLSSHTQVVPLLITHSTPPTHDLPLKLPRVSQVFLQQLANPHVIQAGWVWDEGEPVDVWIHGQSCEVKCRSCLYDVKGGVRKIKFHYIRSGFLFFWVWIHTANAQLNYIRNAHRWRCSNRVARKRPARRHSRHGPWNEWQAVTLSFFSFLSLFLQTQFFFLKAATKLSQVHQERTQVVCSNKVGRNRLAESNGTPAMDPGYRNIDLT